VVTVAGAIDREADASLNITVRATSADGSTADQVFTIAVNDVDEFAVTTPPTRTRQANAVDENSTVGRWSALPHCQRRRRDDQHVVTYSLTDNAGGKFAINSDDWRGHGRGSDRPRSRRQPEHHGARHQPGRLAPPTRCSRSPSTTVDEFAVTTPADTNAAANAVTENSAIGTVVGVTGTPATPMPPRTRDVLADEQPGRAVRHRCDDRRGDHGRGDQPRDAGASVTIEVTATSADTSTSVQSFGIAINDVNEFAVTTPADTNVRGQRRHRERRDRHAGRHHCSAGDADATNNGVTYALSSNPGGLFAIDATTGVVTTAAAIDREALGASATSRFAPPAPTARRRTKPSASPSTP
jgi:hypothetical protein